MVFKQFININMSVAFRNIGASLDGIRIDLDPSRQQELGHFHILVPHSHAHKLLSVFHTAELEFANVNDALD